MEGCRLSTIGKASPPARLTWGGNGRFYSLRAAPFLTSEAGGHCPAAPAEQIPGQADPAARGLRTRPQWESGPGGCVPLLLALLLALWSQVPGPSLRPNRPSGPKLPAIWLLLPHRPFWNFPALSPLECLPLTQVPDSLLWLVPEFCQRLPAPSSGALNAVQRPQDTCAPAPPWYSWMRPERLQVSQRWGGSQALSIQRRWALVCLSSAHPAHSHPRPPSALQMLP